MSIFQTIAQALRLGSGATSVQNSVSVGAAMYGQDIMDAFSVNSGGSAGMAVTAQTAMRVGAVYACVQKISGAIATLPIHTYKTNGDINARVPRDDLWYKLNEQPSEMWTAMAHWEGVSVSQLLRGDSYSWIRKSPSGTIREILPLPWGSVSPMRHSDGSVRYYIGVPDLNLTTWLDPSEVLHFHGFGFDGLRSQSVISQAAKAAVGTALAMDQYSGKFFENGAHPSTILKAAGKMSPEQQEALKTAYAQKYSGVENFHRVPLILTEGLDAKEISINAVDAQLLESRRFQVVDIARIFGIPPHMIGETSASTSWGSGIESMNRGFVTYTLQPHLVRIEQELNRKLFPRQSGRFVRFDREALLEGDSTAQAAYNRAALGGPGTGMGWMSVDEVRKTKGLAPQGGDAANIFDPRTAAPAPAPAASDPEPTPPKA